jgi:hypothetical protein
MTKKTMILVAVGQLIFGIAPAAEGEKPERLVLEDGEEVTEAILKKVGVKKDDIVALIDGGKIAEMSVREAQSGDVLEADLAEALNRAQAAESKLAEAEKRATTAETSLAEAIKKIGELEKTIADGKAKA